jgi:hypothetical protein
MNLTPVYTIECPNCHGRISLLDTMLEQIVRSRHLSATGDPFLVLVCTYCKQGFRYNYAERSSWVMMPTPEPSPDQKYPIRFSFPAGCANDNCRSQVELIAVRDAGTTTEQVVAEFPQWNLDGIVCEHNHPILVPDPRTSHGHPTSDDQQD